MSDQPNLDEQLISQAAQAGLSGQLDEADDINIDVHTDLLKAAQGKADSVVMSGHGVVVKDIRMQEMNVQTDRVSINPFSVLFGNVKLDHPLDASAQVVLTEADLERAMNAEAVTSRMPPLTLNVAGDRVLVELQYPVKVTLPDEGKIALQGAALLHEAKGSRRVGFSVVMVPRTDEHPVLLEAFECEPGHGMTIEFTIALMQKFKELLELPYIEIEGMAIHVKKLEIKQKKMAISTEAYIPQIPSL